MPGNGFSLTVFIGCEPYFLGFLCLGTQISYKLCLLFGNLVFWFERLLVNTQLLLLQIADVTIARHHLKVLSQELFYRLRLGRRLHNH